MRCQESLYVHCMSAVVQWYQISRSRSCRLVATSLLAISLELYYPDVPLRFRDAGAGGSGTVLEESTVPTCRMLYSGQLYNVSFSHII